MLDRLDSTAEVPRVVVQHVGAAGAATAALCHSQREEFEQPVRRWAGQFAAAVAARSSCWLRSLSSIADSCAKKLEARVAALRLADWKVRLGAGEPKGAPKGAAFRWLKGQAGWQPSPQGDPERNEDVLQDPEESPRSLEDDDVLLAAGAHARAQVPLCDQAAVEQEADAWAQLWQEDRQYDGPALPPDLALAGELMPMALSAAAFTLPIGTGLGADNVSPRAFLRLSAAAIAALTTLFMAFERAGTWCNVLDLVLIVLLRKSEGGSVPSDFSPPS